MSRRIETAVAVAVVAAMAALTARSNAAGTPTRGHHAVALLPLKTVAAIGRLLTAELSRTVGVHGSPTEFLL